MNNPIRKLLKPLTKQLINATADATAEPGSIVIGVKGPGIKSTNKAADWRFKTSNEIYSGNYTEIWVPDKGLFGLQSAYLSIFDENSREIIALHCDPRESKTSGLYKYKCGPHVHVSHTIPKVKKAHIALNLSDFEKVVDDIVLLDSALGKGVQMLADEIL
jgi:hypothetical protein